MKSIIKCLIIGVVLLCPLLTYAQTNEERSNKSITYGIKTGVGLSSVLVKGREFYEGKKIGLVLGGFVRYRISESMVLQPELLFVRKGEEAEWVLYGGDIGSNGVASSYIVTRDHKLSYITIPINIYAKVSDKFNVLFGVEPSFLYSEKNITVVNGEEFEDLFNLYGGVRKMDVGLNLGLNYEMSKTLSLDLKLNQGIIKLNKEGGSNVYNSSVQLTMGYALN